MNERFYTCAEVQAKLKISRSTLYRLIREKKLPAMRLRSSYRIRRSDLERFLKSKEVE